MTIFELFETYNDQLGLTASLRYVFSVINQAKNENLVNYYATQLIHSKSHFEKPKMDFLTCSISRVNISLFGSYTIKTHDSQFTHGSF